MGKFKDLDLRQRPFNQSAFEPEAMPPSPGKTDTSREAAEKVRPVLKGLRLKVFDCLRIAGRNGLTPDETIKLFDGEHPDYSIRPRLTELVAYGYAEDSGKRRNNRRDNNEIVYRYIPE